MSRRGAGCAPDSFIFGQGDNDAAYIFTEPVDGWASQPHQTQSAELTASDGEPIDSFGHSVAVTGTTVVAAAPFASFGGIDYQGAIYVFGTPPPPQVHFVLGGVTAPGPGSRWRRGSAVMVAVTVHYAGGPSIPASLAAELASG